VELSGEMLKPMKSPVTFCPVIAHLEAQPQHPVSQCSFLRNGDKSRADGKSKQRAIG
jgi:hypothetical protein